MDKSVNETSPVNKEHRELYYIDKALAANRCMKASRDIKGGTLLYKTDPLCTATFSHNRHLYCNMCLQSKSSLSKCGKCNSVYYCGIDCQRSDWSFHKKECPVLQKVGTKTNKITNQFLLVLRCYIKYQENQEDFRKKIGDLISNVDEFPESKAQFFEEMATVLMRYLEVDPFSEPGGFIPFMKSFIAKLMVNSFTIYNNDNDTIASAIFFPSNYINHSCDPNAIAIYKGKKQCIYTLRDVKENEEINVSYCSYIKPFYDRHHFLLENYFFSCKCSKCTKDKEGCRTTLICPECKKGEILQQSIDKFQCDKCKKDLSLSDIHSLHEEENRLQALLGSQRLEDRINTWEKIMRIITQDSGFNNEVLESISRMYIQDEMYDEAYESDTVLLKRMRKWYMKNDPIIGWKCLELAKLASALCKYNEAKDYVSKGLEILEKYFLIEEMPDFKELILDIQNNFEFRLNQDMLPVSDKK